MTPDLATYGYSPRPHYPSQSLDIQLTTPLKSTLNRLLPPQTPSHLGKRNYRCASGPASHPSPSEIQISPSPLSLPFFPPQPPTSTPHTHTHIHTPIHTTPHYDRATQLPTTTNPHNSPLRPIHTTPHYDQSTQLLTTTDPHNSSLRPIHTTPHFDQFTQLLTRPIRTTPHYDPIQTMSSHQAPSSAESNPSTTNLPIPALQCPEPCTEKEEDRYWKQVEEYVLSLPSGSDMWAARSRSEDWKEVIETSEKIIEAYILSFHLLTTCGLRGLGVKSGGRWLRGLRRSWEGFMRNMRVFWRGWTGVSRGLLAANEVEGRGVGEWRT